MSNSISKKKGKVVEFDLIKSIAAGIPLQPIQFILAKKLADHKVIVERGDINPDDPANEGLLPGDKGYKWLTTKEEELSLFQRAVVIKVDSGTLYMRERPNVDLDKTHSFYPGDVIVYTTRASMDVDFMPGYVLIRPYDIIGHWDNNLVSVADDSSLLNNEGVANEQRSDPE